MCGMQNEVSSRSWAVIQSLVIVSLSLCFTFTAHADFASIRVVTELSPPHQMMKEGKVDGFSTQIVEAILKNAGLNSRIEVYPWARAFYIASSTPNVLIYNMARTPERENQFHWIGPVAKYSFGLVRLADRTDLTPNHVKDLGSAVIAVQRGDFSGQWLQQQGMKEGKELQFSADILESWNLLLKGKVDYVIDDKAALPYMEQQLTLVPGTTRFVLAIPQLEQQTYLAASKNSDSALVKKLQQAHREVQKTNIYQYVISGGF
ncbi:transporter substrate-binding domain-containing protein [Rheinheimera sediminis]|nr:transporter substrate-binding domain-containing protein [Rheinheimera sp. YQF-1]